MEESMLQEQTRTVDRMEQKKTDISKEVGIAIQIENLAVRKIL